MATNGYVGTLSGQFAVDHNGEAVYSMSLTVPPGTAEMKPSLSLVYNSGGSNGMLGMGWSLQGLSSITRTPATIAQDGFIGAVNYDSNDRFSLDGQRLVPVSAASYQDPNAIYHTEIESWKKVVPVYNQQRPQSRSGPDSFIVYTKNGRRLEYGTSPDAQVSASNTNPSIRVWALNKVTDLNGNFMTITYQQDTANNAFYPLNIQYTGNTNTGLVPQRSVQFAYESRPDTWFRYLGGYPVGTLQRLKTIQTYVDGQLVTTYSLAYQTGQSTGRSQLQSITQSDTTGVALSPTLFTWQDGNPGIFDTTQALPDTHATWQGQLLPMDVNGDGRTDLVNAYSANGYLGLTLFLSDGTAFSPPTGLVLPPTQIHYSEGAQILPIDLNGDGCVDLVYAMNNEGHLGLTTLLAQPDGQGGWTYAPGPINGAGPSNIPWGRLTTMDVNGDGLVDLVCAYDNNGTLGLKILFSDGSSFAPKDQDRTVVTAAYYSGAQLLPVQFNGDTMCDLLYAFQNGANFEVVLFLSQGWEGFVQQNTNPVPSATTLSAQGILMILDVNGDGMGDLVHASLNNETLVLQTLLSTGDAFTSGMSQNVSLTNPGASIPILLPMEVNGDGLPDLVIATQNNNQICLQVLLSTGSGFAAQSGVTQPSASLPWGAALLPMDVDGDGRSDLVYAVQSAVNSKEILSLAHSPASGVYPDLIASVTNGLGGQVTPTYKPLTDPNVYSKGSSVTQQIEAPGLINNVVSGATYHLSATRMNPTPGVTYATQTVDFPKYVVAGYGKGDGRGSTYNFNYFYTGAKIDLTGRGWLGFESIRVTDPQYQTITLTDYNQPFPQTATVSSSLITRSADGAWMQQTTIGYTTPSPDTGIYQCLPQSVQTNFYTFAPPPAPGGQPAPDDIHTLRYTYDDYGNKTLTVDAGASTVYTLESYDNDPLQWLLGFKSERKLAADQAGTQILSREQMTFYPNTQNLETHQVWDDQHHVWLVTKYAYDAYGNVTTITDPSGAVSTMAYDSTYSTFLARATSPPNQAGVSLVSTFQFYPQFGVMNTRTDSNQVMFQQDIDGLGRVTQQLGPDLSNPSNMLVLTKRSWLSGTDGPYTETQRRLDWPGTTWTCSQQDIDGLSRVYKSTALGPDGATTVLVNTAFDSRDNVVSQSLPYYEGTTPVYMQRVYDNYGRLLQSTQPVDGGTSTTTLNYVSTNTLIQTEAAGTSEARTTTLEYGTFHSKRLVVKRTDANQAVTIYTYDPLGRIVASVDPFPVTNTVTYDSLGRQITLQSKTSNSVLSSETFTYDDVNRRVIHAYASGTQITLVYDALKRLISKAVGTQITTLAYDVSGQPGAMGRLCNVTAPDGTTYTYGYDPYGNQTRITLVTGGARYGFQKTYTPTRQVQQLTYPDQSVLTNKYNAAGRLQTVSMAESGQAATFATFDKFTPFGASQTVTYGNAVQEALGYNDVGQLKSQVLNGPDGTFQNLALNWNALNAVQTIADQLAPTSSQTFTFDPVGRLQRATGGYPAKTYGYDHTGNLTLKDGVVYAYTGYQVNQGTQNGQQVFSAQYDTDGNMKTMTNIGGSRTLVYDDERQLIQADGATFTYDYTGRQLKKQAANGPTTLYVSPYYEVATFPDGSVQHTKYVTGTNGLIASVTTVDSGIGNPVNNPFKGVPVAGACYFHKNHLGSTTALTNGTGQVTTTVNYLPYGEIDAINGPDTFRYKFTGKELDPETSLYYFRSRYYDPALGRFITADSKLGGPFHMQDVFNRYAYALNSPVHYTDPTGHSVLWDIEHFFSHDVSHFFTHDVKGFFTHDVTWFFTNRIVENVISFIVDAALVVGGIIVMATTPFGGAGSTVIGSMLLGAGISGLTYNITGLAKHQQFSWAGWGEQLGIGAASGLIAGGVAAGASAVVGAVAASYAGDAAAAALQGDMELQGSIMSRVATWAPGGAARLAVNTAAATIGNGASGAVSDVLSNLASHTSLTKGLGWDTLIGAATGAAAGVLSEAVGGALAQRYSGYQILSEQNPSKYPEYWDSDLHAWNFNKMLAREGEVFIADTKWNNFWMGMPGTAFSGIDAFFTSIGLHPNW